MPATINTHALTARPGGAGELLHMAWPLIISSSFSTVQITLDRHFASRLSADAAAAATNGAMFFWTPFILLFSTSGYVATFVAQYLGAGRPQRIGPIVWQGLYFSIAAGLAMLAFIPFRREIFAWTGHSPHIQEMECEFFAALSWMGLPALLASVTCSFFSGRQETRTVIWINLAGTIVNALLDYAWVLGRWGFAQQGLTGAGWATTVASWVSALLGLALMFRKKFCVEYRLLAGWHFEVKAFLRLMRYGLPSGIQWFLDMTAFSSFLLLTGRFGDTQLDSSSLAYSINNFTFIPMFGLSQAVSILVGRRLGEDRPEIAERSVKSSFLLAAVYMCGISSLYLIFPATVAFPFEETQNPAKWAAVFAELRILFFFIAGYAFFDSMTLMFSAALRGAGDTLFVTLVSLTLAWPVMVIPTWLSVHYGWGLYWAWGFLSAYVILQGFIYRWRFLGGKWKKLRVIEPEPIL